MIGKSLIIIALVCVPLVAHAEDACCSAPKNALTSFRTAPPTGPILMDLGDSFWAAQMNAYPLTVGDIVGVYRSGQEIAQGQVFRIREKVCTVRLFTPASLIRGDAVGRLKAVPGGAGPEIPSALLQNQSQSYGSHVPSYSIQARPSSMPNWSRFR